MEEYATQIQAVHTKKKEQNCTGESDQESNKNILQTIQNENYKLLYHLCFRVGGRQILQHRKRVQKEDYCKNKLPAL